MLVRNPDDAAVFLPANKVGERYGVSSMTLWRWLKEESMNFPRPIYIGRYRFWRIDELQAWEAEQTAKRDEQAA